MLLRCGFVVLLLMLATSYASAQTTKIGDLAVVEPWARATIGQGKTGAAYLTIVNRGTAADRLIAVTTPAARMAQLHTHIMEGGVMKMRPVEALEIESQETTEFKPGGLHIMLMGLDRPLKKGESFPMTLTFEKAGKVAVAVTVAGATAKRAVD